MSNFVVFRTFNSRNEAEAVHAILSGSGIEAFVESDDCGALDPALAFGRGVQLFVAEEDAERARDILTAAGSETPEWPNRPTLAPALLYAIGTVVFP